MSAYYVLLSLIFLVYKKPLYLCSSNGASRQRLRASEFSWNTFLAREFTAAGLDDWCEVLYQGCVWSQRFGVHFLAMCRQFVRPGLTVTSIFYVSDMSVTCPGVPVWLSSVAAAARTRPRALSAFCIFSDRWCKAVSAALASVFIVADCH